jgi:choline dehydrogenase-like flavoprotein
MDFGMFGGDLIRPWRRMNADSASPLSGQERRAIAAIAEAAMPRGRFLESGGMQTAEAVEQLLAGLTQGTTRAALRAGFMALELRTLGSHGRRFSTLSLGERMQALLAWEQSENPTARAFLRGILTPLRFVHFDDPKKFAHVGCQYELGSGAAEPARWMAQVTDGRSVTEDLTLECEVVVVGTGAGGAAAAYELASRGRAVLLLEEGDYHRRSSFRGRPSHAYKDLYRDEAMTMAFGNVTVPLWTGRAVGGSTVINSGTCYRAPERTLRRWRTEMGLPSVFSSEGLGPYYERVERMLEVAPGNPLHLGAIAGIIARGAEHLGYSHHALHRNAPGCDGQGVCCFGCPTGAKRSTDVSYVPEALKCGAQLVTAAHVDRVEIIGGRARGVTVTLGVRGPRGDERRKLTVKADAVVVAGGALMTPLLLRQSGAARSSKMLGKNLSIHPATKVLALFDEKVEQWRGIPQSYTIDHFADEGILFEGGSLPFDVAALSVPWTGQRYTDMMEQYPYLATFGFMIQDTSRGEVRQGPGGSPLMFYRLNDTDAALLQRGVGLLCDVYQKAGARRVFPFVAGHDEVNTASALVRLRTAKLRAGDVELSAFHPLGTCRIGVDPSQSCLGPDHEVHDVEGLYVTDGSAIPSSLGVNPQMTIMATALRAAEIIDSRLR